MFAALLKYSTPPAGPPGIRFAKAKICDDIPVVGFALPVHNQNAMLPGIPAG